MNTACFSKFKCLEANESLSTKQALLVSIWPIPTISFSWP